MMRFPAFMCAALLAGCASLSQDGGLADVSRLAQERLGQPVSLSISPPGNSDAVIGELLAKPLTLDAAVRIALLNNASLKAAFAELGVAEADFVQSGRLGNPGFSFGKARSGSDTEISRSIMFDLAGILTLPARQRIERGRFEQAKLQTAAQAVQLAGDTRAAWFMAVSAAQSAAVAERVRTAAEASTELGVNMARAGNWSTLDQAHERVFYQDAVTQLARARQEALAAREQLIRLLGLWGEQLRFTLPDRLPELPAHVAAINDAEAQAMSQRLEILSARRETEATASALGLTKATRFINVLDAGYASRSTTGSPRENGYEISLELPLFDWSGAKVARAEALYMQSVHRTTDTAVRVRSEVREAYVAYRTAYDIARHQRDDVVPLRKKISDEVMLRFNGMLVGVFDLLADAREQLGSVNTAIETQRDFWIAETRLQSAVAGGVNTEPRTMP